MPSLPASMLLLANRLLPEVGLPGDTDPMDYAAWERATADGLVELFDACLAEGPDPRRALDVGCGYGGKTGRLRELTGDRVEWTAFDLSMEHLRHAGAWFGRQGNTGIHRVRGDAGLLPFADGSFDRIVSADALEHLPRPEQSLAEMRRCLHPEGRLVLLFNPWASPRGSHLGDLLRLPWCQVLFSRDTLVEATRAEADRAARLRPAEASRIRAHAESLVEHFTDHVHPTRIADFRQWAREVAGLEIVTERHFGPGPLRDAGWIGMGWCEEFFSATYGAVLRPAASFRSDSKSSSRSAAR